MYCTHTIWFILSLYLLEYKFVFEHTMINVWLQTKFPRIKLKSVWNWRELEKVITSNNLDLPKKIIFLTFLHMYSIWIKRFEESIDLSSIISTSVLFIFIKYLLKCSSFLNFSVNCSLEKWPSAIPDNEWIVLQSPYIKRGYTSSSSQYNLFP